MARIAWKRSEIDFIIDNYESMTTDEICEAFPNRSRKSINRKLEQLRDEGKIGHRKTETVRRAYRQREKTRSRPDNAIGRKRGIPMDDYTYEEV